MYSCLLEDDLYNLLKNGKFLEIQSEFLVLSGKNHVRKSQDDLTDTIFAGHHQPLKVWILCLYFMGLNLSNEQIAHELSINESDAYQMTTELRGGIVKKCRP
jgi:hypothetical protein